MDEQIPNDPGEGKNKALFKVWMVLIPILLFLLIFAVYYRPPVSLQVAVHRRDLLQSIRFQLADSLAATKNAIITKEVKSSVEFAERAQQGALKLEDTLRQFQSLSSEKDTSEEREHIEQFGACWSELRQLNSDILGLAVQESNIQAQRLSTETCAEEMSSVEASLREIITSATIAARCDQTIPLSYEVLTAGLKILSLHKSHIEEESDEQMDAIESKIRAYDLQAKSALAALHKIPGMNANENLLKAETSYEHFMVENGEVLRLSRLNTNIKSAGLSLGKQSVVSERCDANLMSLEKDVKIEPFIATK